jgi:MFS family permease
VDDQQPHITTHLTPGPVPHEVAPPTPQQKQSARGILAAITIDVTPLKTSRDFRLLFIGQAVSFFGSMMTYVVLPWQMYQLTKSSFAVGMLGAVEFVPILLMSCVGGALADYVDRRKLLRFTEVGLACITGILILNSLLRQPKVWVLFVCAALFAALNGLQRPSREAITPRIVAPEEMPAVAALNSLRFSAGAIAGPALAGVLAAAFGASLTYSIDLLTFIVSLVTLWMMRAAPPPIDAERPSLRSISEGLRYAKSRPELLGTYLVDINAMFFGMPMALFPAIAESFGNASVGLLYAMPAVGSLIATLTSGWTNRIHKHGLAVIIAATVWGIAIIGFGLANSLWLALVCLALAGGADMVSGLFRMTIWNQTIPDHLRGRLAGIEMVSYTTGPMLGNAEAGIVASLFSIRTSVISGGILCVLGSGLLAVLLPSLLHYDGRAGLARKESEEEARARAATLSTDEVETLTR